METKNIFVVVTNSDLTEGRGHPVEIAYCEAETTAKRLAKGRGVMGSNAEVRNAIAVYSNGRWCAPVRIEQPNSEDQKTQAILDKRKSIIAKALELGLTGEDLKAMGVRHD